MGFRLVPKSVTLNDLERRNSPNLCVTCSFSTIFYAISLSDTCLRSRKNISKPKIDKISQSTAEMNYFRFRKTDGHHIGFPFQVSILTYV